jgi:ribonucleoside-diphosphate reductase alpha chain
MSNAKKTKYTVKIDKNRNDFLTDFGKAVLQDRYLLKNEDNQDLSMK